MSPLIGRRVRYTTRGYGNAAPETLTGTVQAVAFNQGERPGFDLLVEVGGVDLVCWTADSVVLVPSSPLARLFPAWALPHIPAALGGGIILAASIVGAHVLAAVL